MQIEKLTQEEYCHLLSFGEPYAVSACADMYDPLDLDENENHPEWISTLDSTTYPGTTFGYHLAPHMYTSL